jgi:hypothetical protein
LTLRREIKIHAFPGAPGCPDILATNQNPAVGGRPEVANQLTGVLKSLPVGPAYRCLLLIGEPLGNEHPGPHGKLASSSTLRRRLSEYHLSFRLIREEIIEAIGKQSLAHTRTPISSISLELGYSEPAAFVHAFKRIAGMTPSEYRKQNREG